MAISKVEVEMYKCKCERCGHRWQTEDKPRRCAKCKSPYWDVKPTEK